MTKKADTNLLWFLIGLVLAALIIALVLSGVLFKVFDLFVQLIK